MYKINQQIIQDDEIDLKVLFSVLWSNRKLIIKITGIITVLGVIYSLISTPQYLSTISMYPSYSDGGSSLSQLQGVASSFGIDVGGTETAFHVPDIVGSRRLKTRIIEKKWDSSEFTSKISLITYWKINDRGISLNPMYWVKSLLSDEDVDPYPDWLESALEIISERISVSEEKSGLVVVKVWMEEAKLASDIANYIYNEIVDYTTTVHNAQAKLNTEFIHERQNEVKIALSSSEETLKLFRERNRNIVGSPQLQLELGRLMRDVDIQTEVFITLQQQYELARIEEVKEMPSVVILDSAKPAIEKDKPKRKLIVILSFLLGGIFSLGTVLIQHSIKRFK